nr:putative glycoside hydrolase [Sedimentibacter sp.]
MFKNVRHAILLLILTAVLTACTNPASANSPIPGEETNEPANETPQGEQPSQPEISEEEKAAIELEKKIAEREEIEKTRKEEYKEFYVPLVPLSEQREKKYVEVRALYATGHTAGNDLNKENIDAYSEYVKALQSNDKALASSLYAAADKANKFERIVGIADATEINGLVINVKDDNGFITYESDVEIVQKMNQNTPIPTMDS